MEGSDQHTRKKVQCNEVDRLSDLPDPIIHHILSLMETKYAVRTCILSRKWTHHWTHIHTLSFHRSNGFKRAKYFDRFVRHVLRHRKPSKLSKLIFYYWGRGRSNKLPQRVFNYAKSHNIEELDTNRYGSEFPPSFFKCQTLIFLKLNGFILNMPTGFATLRTLQLSHVDLYCRDLGNDFLSGCLNLQNLVITKCQLRLPAETFNITASQLENLTISGLECKNYYFVPKKNWKLVVSAPRLKIFGFKGQYGVQLIMDKCQKLENVSIHMFPSYCCRNTNDWKQDCISDMPRMVEEFSQAKFLSLSVKISESSQEKLISYFHRR